MDVPDEQGQFDELSAAEASRARWVAGAVVLVLVLGGVAVARAGHHANRHRQSLPPPVRSSVPAVAPRVNLGSVFLEHLPQCTATDHHHRLTVAMAVTNLGDRSLRLVGASGLTSDPFVVRPTTLSVGGPPCGRAEPGQDKRIASGDVLVVRLRFYVADKCPSTAIVSARVAFDGGRDGEIHADSSQLADLSRLGFAQCA